MLTNVWNRDCEALREHLLYFAAKRLRDLMALPVWTEFERANECMALEICKRALLTGN